MNSNAACACAGGGIQVVRLIVRTRDLDERVDVSNGRDVIGDERLEFCFQVNGVRLVLCDELEQVPDVLGYIEVLVLVGRAFQTVEYWPKS